VVTVLLKVYIHSPIERVWELFSDHEGYARFKAVSFAKLLKEGQGDRNGVGAVREIHALGVKFVEDILVFKPPRRLDYKVVKCTAPLEHEIGRMDLIQRGEGTELHWITRFRVKLPLVGPLLAPLARLQTRDKFYDLLLEAKDMLEAGPTRGS